MNYSSFESEPLEPTTDKFGEWKITVNWRRLRTPNDTGHIFPAGVEVRGWHRGVGLDAETADRAVISTPRRPPELSSYVLGRLRWGELLKHHRRLLEKQLKSKSTAARSLASESPHHARAVRRAHDFEEIAGDASVDPKGRANPKTHELVLELYRVAEREHPNAKALAVLKALQRANYDLDPANNSDRVKVRRWISEARKKDSLPPVKTERNEDK